MADAIVTSTGPQAGIDGVRGVVLAVCASTVYAELDDARMLVVHDARHGRTPCSLVVDDFRPAAAGLAPGDAVAGRLGWLQLGALRLDARQASSWQPRAASRRFAAVPPHSLAAQVSGLAGDAVARLRADCARLTAALAGDDTTPAGEHAARVSRCARALVGAGPGLTPSGDDALVGLLAVLHRAGPAALAAGPRAALDAALPPLLHRTTTISAHFLRLALAGHFGEALSELVDGLDSEGRVRADLVERVRATGASSGADALAGVVAGLALLCDLQSIDPLEEAA